MEIGTVADWFVGVATVFLAIVAIWQEPIRAIWSKKPKLVLSVSAAPPACAMVPVTDNTGANLGNRLYLRIAVKNEGKAAAKNVEVYALQLEQRKPHSDAFYPVSSFPPMNLKWANTPGYHFMPVILPMLIKHCDVAHIHDPKWQARVGENPFIRGSTNLIASGPGTAAASTAAPDIVVSGASSPTMPTNPTLVFELQTSPNHKGHIVQSGAYVLTVIVSAEDFEPVQKRLFISFSDDWHDDEAEMLKKVDFREYEKSSQS
jgi:hypothetical protein